MNHRMLLLAIFAGLAVPTPDSLGQDRKFPYEAAIDTDGELVRCGPGQKFYPTAKLTRGQTVTVHRHDPGGWAMIAPPPGSFSWIQADYVQSSDLVRGTLTANNVVVHVGSSLGEERSVYQRTLSKGDVVEILDQVEATGNRGPVKLYKIKPPLREYRWIATKALVAAEGVAPTAPAPRRGPAPPAPNIRAPIAFDLTTPNPALAEDPFAAAPKTDGPLVPTQPAAFPTGEAVPSRTLEGAAIAVGPQPAPEPIRQQFVELDEQLRNMLQQPPETWNLSSMDLAFRQLDLTTDHPGTKAQIAQRLRTIQKYGTIQQDFEAFTRLTTTRRERDAQLLSMQRQTEEQLRQLNGGQLPVSASAGPVPTVTLPNAPQAAQNSANGSQPPGPQPIGSSLPIPGTPTPATPNLPSPAPSSPAAPAGPMPAFSAAGIIQRNPRAQPMTPAFLLVAPNGRFLTYLDAPAGLDLTPYVGHSFGVVGPRAFRPDFKADLTTVRELHPVQLRND